MPSSSVKPFSNHVKNLIGQKSGRLTVVEFSRVKKDRALWKCECSCGGTCIVSGDTLNSGKTRSCGCLRQEASRRQGKKNRKHGHAMGANKLTSPEYNTWFGMKQRCYDKKSNSYERYGARGISVCERWRKSFVNFLADVGEKPGPEFSLDRINNSGNYEPGNTRWSTRKEQGRNKRNNRFIEFQGERLCVSEWVEKLGIPRSRIIWRLDEGWSDEKALTTPSRKKKKPTQHESPPRGCGALAN